VSECCELIRDERGEGIGLIHTKLKAAPFVAELGSGTFSRHRTRADAVAWITEQRARKLSAIGEDEPPC
jgi:hypothetical protein